MEVADIGDILDVTKYDYYSKGNRLCSALRPTGG